MTPLDGQERAKMRAAWTAHRWAGGSEREGFEAGWRACLADRPRESIAQDGRCLSIWEGKRCGRTPGHEGQHTYFYDHGGETSWAVRDTEQEREPARTEWVCECGWRAETRPLIALCCSVTHPSEVNARMVERPVEHLREGEPRGGRTHGAPACPHCKSPAGLMSAGSYQCTNCGSRFGEPAETDALLKGKRQAQKLDDLHERRWTGGEPADE